MTADDDAHRLWRPTPPPPSADDDDAWHRWLGETVQHVAEDVSRTRYEVFDLRSRVSRTERILDGEGNHQRGLVGRVQDLEHAVDAGERILRQARVTMRAVWATLAVSASVLAGLVAVVARMAGVIG